MNVGWNEVNNDFAWKFFVLRRVMTQLILLILILSSQGAHLLLSLHVEGNSKAELKLLKYIDPKQM